jgi:hypothetical protein
LYGNDTLSSFEGLESLHFIGGDLGIEGNYNVNSLSGFSALDTIGGSLSIAWQWSLLNLTGLSHIKVVNGGLTLSSNNQLQEITALSNLTSINGTLWISSNWVLTSLSGLDNINSASVSGLFIVGNNLLATCEVQSICDYLVSPGGYITIQNNAPGCNSPEEVEAACEALAVHEPGFPAQVSSYPNPFTSSATLEFELEESGLVDFEIVNQFDQVVDQFVLQGQKGMNRFTWHAGSLPAGVYICQILSPGGQSSRKMVLMK